MNEFEYLATACRVRRMGRSALEDFLRGLDEAVIDSAREEMGAAEACERYASTARYVNSRLAESTVRRLMGGRAHARLRSPRPSDAASIGRDAQEELREIAELRLARIERRDGFAYRPRGSTPLERYLESIGARDA